MEKNSSDSETEASIYLPPTSEHQTPDCNTKIIKREDRPYIEGASLKGRVGSPCSDLMEQMVTMSQNLIENSQESEKSVDYNRISLSQDYFADESCSVDENMNINIQGHAQHNILEMDQMPSPDDNVFYKNQVRDLIDVKSHLILDPNDSILNDPEYLYLTNLPPPVSPIPTDVDEIDDTQSNTIKLFSSSPKFSSDLDSKLISTKPRISLCMPDLSTDVTEIQRSNNLPQRINASGNSNSNKEDQNKSQSNSDLLKITSKVPFKNRRSSDVATSSYCSADIKVRDNSSSTDLVSSFESDLSREEHVILLPHKKQNRDNSSSTDLVSSFESDLSREEHVILLPHKKQKKSSSLASGPSREERQVNTTNKTNPEENYTIIQFYINTLDKNKRLAKSRRGKYNQSSSFSRRRTYFCEEDYYRRNKNSRRTNRKPFQAHRIDRTLRKTPIQQDKSMCLRYVRDILDNYHLEEKFKIILIRRLLNISEETTTDTD